MATNILPHLPHKGQSPTLPNNRIVGTVANAITAAVALLVFLIAAGSFVLSYNALKETGAAYGIAPAWVWLWPLLIDGPLVVFTLALLVSQLNRQPIRLWAGLVIGYTLGTIAFNLIHAAPSPVGWFVAIVAPLGLLLSTEALRHLAKGYIDRQAAALSLAELLAQGKQAAADLDKVTQQIDRQQAKLDDLKQQADQVKSRKNARSVEEMNAAKQEKIEQRRQQVLNLLGEGLTKNQIAESLGVGVKTIQRDIKELNGQVMGVTL